MTCGGSWIKHGCPSLSRKLFSPSLPTFSFLFYLINSVSFIPFLLDIFSPRPEVIISAARDQPRCGPSHRSQQWLHCRSCFSSAHVRSLAPRDVALSSDTGSVCEPRPGTGPAPHLCALNGTPVRAPAAAASRKGGGSRNRFDLKQAAARPRLMNMQMFFAGPSCVLVSFYIFSGLVFTQVTVLCEQQRSPSWLPRVWQLPHKRSLSAFTFLRLN